MLKRNHLLQVFRFLVFSGPDSSELLAQKENFLNHGVLPNFSQLEKKQYNHTKGKGK